MSAGSRRNKARRRRGLVFTLPAMRVDDELGALLYGVPLEHYRALMRYWSRQSVPVKACFRGRRA